MLRPLSKNTPQLPGPWESPQHREFWAKFQRELAVRLGLEPIYSKEKTSDSAEIWRFSEVLDSTGIFWRRLKIRGIGIFKNIQNMFLAKRVLVVPSTLWWQPNDQNEIPEKYRQKKMVSTCNPNSTSLEKQCFFSSTPHVWLFSSDSSWLLVRLWPNPSFFSEFLPDTAESFPQKYPRFQTCEIAFNSRLCICQRYRSIDVPGVKGQMVFDVFVKLSNCD